MTDAYLNTALTAVFGTGPFYLMLINSTGYVGIDRANDSMSSHASWTEFTGYTESTRPQWVPGVASGKQITNPGSASVHMSADGEIVGYALVTSPTKGGTTGSLVTHYILPSPQSFLAGDPFRIDHTNIGKDVGAGA